jgi:hypothetical protein
VSGTGLGVCLLAGFGISSIEIQEIMVYIDYIVIWEPKEGT